MPLSRFALARSANPSRTATRYEQFGQGTERACPSLASLRIRFPWTQRLERLLACGQSVQQLSTMLTMFVIVIALGQVPGVAGRVPVPFPHSVLRPGGRPRGDGGSGGRDLPRAQEEPGVHPQEAGRHEGRWPRRALCCEVPMWSANRKCFVDAASVFVLSRPKP